MPLALTIRDLPAAERPRERLMTHGADKLAAQELLAVVLGRGVAGNSVTAIAHELLKRFGSLQGVVSASLEELQDITGLGPAKAVQLKACLEIARRVIQEEGVAEKGRQTAAQLTNPSALAQLVRSLVRETNKEHLFVICGDSRARVVGIDLIAVGTVNSSVAHPREIFEKALDRHATAIVVSHNHPSGDTEPSAADKLLTAQLASAGRIMGITLLDHVIVTQTSFYSFREHGLV